MPRGEPAVLMRRFDQQALLSRRLGGGCVADEDMDALAEQVARLHTQAAVATWRSWAGRWRRHRPSMLPPRRCVNAWPLWPWCCPRWRRGRWATCSGWNSGAPPGSVALQGVWAQRWRGGHVRECHGDLHPGQHCLD